MRGRRSPRIVAVAVALAVTTVLVAGCSSDGSDGSIDLAPDDGAVTTTAADAGPTTTQDLSFHEETATAAAYADALDDGLSEGSADEGQIVVTGEQAVCIAPLWIGAIKVSNLVAHEISPGILADPAYQFGELELDVDQAGAMLDAYATCGADVFGLFAVAITTDQTAEVQACAVASLDHDLARTALVSALTGAPSLSTDLNALYTQVEDAC